MMTIITRVRLRPDAAEQWDRVMHTRLAAAREAKGWASAQLLRGLDDQLDRAIVGVWHSREDWAEWHEDEAFRATREELAGIEQAPEESSWFEVVDAG